LREAETKYREKSVELHKIETELEKERGEHLRHAAAVERFAEIERQLENNLERSSERGEGLQRESVRAEENYSQHRAETENLAASISVENEKLKKMHAEKQHILVAAGEARAQLRNTEDVLKNLRNEFSRKRNRLETCRNSKKNARFMRRRCRNFLPRNRKSALNLREFSPMNCASKKRRKKRLKIFSAITCKAFWLNPMKKRAKQSLF
jgi:chromosome segregation ATPase